MANKDVTAFLYQKDMFNRSRLFEIIKGRRLLVSNKVRRREWSYRISLYALDPESSRITRRVWWLLITGLVVPVSTIICFFIFHVFDINIKQYILPSTIVSVLLMCSFILLFFYKSENKQVYFSRHAKVPIIELMVGKPNRKKFKQFIQELEQRINYVILHRNLSVAEQHAGELRMLRRLAGEGILDEAQYSYAKSLIFKLSDSTPTDFTDESKNH